MAQDITLLGITYESVPAITLPNTSSQPVRFVDTSEGNATASDIAIGHTAFVNGERIEGTMEPPVRDVNFFDYDGTLLYSYSAEEAATLTALPPNPTHEGLTSQGWNYTLGQMQLEVQVQGQCDIGQMYITDDLKTRIYVHLTPNTLHPYLRFYCDSESEITVRWGDGTVELVSYNDTNYNDAVYGSTDQGYKMASHDYTDSGDYVITLTVNEGDPDWPYVNGLLRFESYGSSFLFNDNPVAVTDNTAGHFNYRNCVKKIEIGANVEIGCHAFDHLSLETITLPNTLNMIGTTISQSTGYAGGIFNYCLALKWITLPSPGPLTAGDGGRGLTGLASYCYSLKGVSFPPEQNLILACDFSYCFNLRRLVIPSTTDSLTTYDFVNETWTYTGMSLKKTSIEKIWVPDEVTKIPYAFLQEAKNIKEFRMPTTITGIGGYAFDQCTLREYPILPNLDFGSYGSYVYNQMVLTSELHIPAGIPTIGGNMFYSAQHVDTMTMSEGVTTINSNAFSNMYSLGTLTIPSTVTTIGNTAFSMAKSLKTMRVLPTTPPTLGSSAFLNLPSDCVIYVPHGCLAAYQAASGWSTYASQMIESAA